ncbi:transcriptional repressor [Amycolatopsis sp. NPDC049253]|uniref:Fur family transcriptional regulator n=1 Tax=Amycolatopsis sp. NPDC049253 TaxID=3155274 RepID=UPI00343DBDC3
MPPTPTLPQPPPGHIDAGARLRRAGLRVTTARQVVLETLAEQPHTTVAELLPHVRRRLRFASTRAIHDVLATGVSAGLVRRFDTVGVAQRYELTGPEHGHLLCTNCGRLDSVGTAEATSAPILTGVCSHCAPDGHAHPEPAR